MQRFESPDLKSQYGNLDCDHPWHHPGHIHVFSSQLDQPPGAGTAPVHMDRPGASSPPESAEMILFDLVVHVGTLISIAIVFRNSLSRFLHDSFFGFLAAARGDMTPKDRLFVKLTLLGLFSVLVTGLIDLPLKVYFESVFAQPVLISVTQVITGLLLW